MTFYHIRYNVYILRGAPVEKEEWLAYPDPQNEQQLKKVLVDRWSADVSIILHQVINEEQYNDKVERREDSMTAQERIDVTNLNQWNIAAPSEMKKKLNDESDESDVRYRNILKPFPLL